MKKYLPIFIILTIFDLQAEDPNITGDNQENFTEMAQEIQQFQTLVIDDLLINSEDQNYLESIYPEDLTKNKGNFLGKVKNLYKSIFNKEKDKN